MTELDPAAVPILAVLKDRDRTAILTNSRRRTWTAGDVVVREGDSALNLFVILAGAARIERDGVVVARMGPGEFFGELGLIQEHARLATVVAEDALTCLLLPSWEFKVLLQQHPQMAVPMLYALIARMHASAPHEH
jgi:CRP/FNR family transcriptional regulator, cyclic AMP receptor protein